jgi:hypothetical protein
VWHGEFGVEILADPLDCAIWRDGASHWRVSRRPGGAHVHLDPGTVPLTTSAAPLVIGREDHLAI